MKKIDLQKVLSVVLMISAAQAMTACTGDEVATAIGVGAIIGGGIAIATTTHCEPGYQNVCHTYTNFAGIVQSECQSQYNSCAVLVPNTMVARAVVAPKDATQDTAASSAAPLPNENLVTSVNWGETFNMGFDGSAQFITALQQARAGNIAALQGLGLSNTDIKSIAQYNMPSAAGVNAVAQTLNQSPASVQAMFTVILTNASEEKAAQ